MPNRRDLIKMTPQEIRSYLEEQRQVIVVTNGPNDLPHPVPMHYGIDDLGRIFITTFGTSQKVRNLERDPRATLLVESGMTYQELKSVIAYCSAEVIRTPELVLQMMRKVRAGDEMANSLSEAMNRQIQASSAKRVAIRFTPFHIVSWDHSKLSEFY